MVLQVHFRGEKILCQCQYWSPWPSDSHLLATALPRIMDLHISKWLIFPICTQYWGRHSSCFWIMLQLLFLSSKPPCYQKSRITLSQSKISKSHISEVTWSSFEKKIFGIFFCFSNDPQLLSHFFCEERRLRTFNGWPLDFIRPIDLAKAGFVFTGSADVVRCVFCLWVSLHRLSIPDTVKKFDWVAQCCEFYADQPGNVNVHFRAYNDDLNRSKRLTLEYI